MWQFVSDYKKRNGQGFEQCLAVRLLLKNQGKMLEIHGQSWQKTSTFGCHPKVQDPYNQPQQ
jgi:hypothetical protein